MGPPPRRCENQDCPHAVQDGTPPVEAAQGGGSATGRHRSEESQSEGSGNGTLIGSVSEYPSNESTLGSGSGGSEGHTPLLQRSPPWAVNYTPSPPGSSSDEPAPGEPRPDESSSGEAAPGDSRPDEPRSEEPN